MKLLIDDFKPISLEDKKLFDKHYAKYPPVHSDNLFTTMISWMKYGNYHYAFTDDCLILMSKIRNRIQFRPPSGKPDRETFDKVLQLAKEKGSVEPLGLIDQQMKEWLIKKYSKLEFIPDRDFFDYVYLANDLAELPGSSYSKIRNRLNKFTRNYSFTIEDITEENMNEVKKFLRRWCLWKDCESDPILENEKKAILYSIAHFFELGLSGIAMRVNEKIESIAVFEKMSNDTAVVHYEKASPDYDGIYKAINAETAKILSREVKFINRESDMGISGLRRAKMSYRPHHMVEVFHLDKKNMVF